MKEKETEQIRNRYEQFWKGALQEGREDFGDLELSLVFLKKTNLLDRQYSILEIGCGIGKLCNALYDMGYKNVIGVDIAHHPLLLGKTRFSRLNLLCMDASSLAFINNCFDICLSFDLAEHLPDIHAHFKEVWRILKPGGKYLFQTPNILSNALYATIIRRGFAWKTYHPSLQTLWSLRKRLRDAGFTKVKFIKIPPVSNFKLQQLPRFAEWILKHIPWKILPLFLQTNFYTIAYK